METASADVAEPRIEVPRLRLACGATIQSGATFVASLRCVDCRDRDAPLDPYLVEQWYAAGAPF